MARPPHPHRDQAKADLQRGDSPAQVAEHGLGSGHAAIEGLLEEGQAGKIRRGERLTHGGCAPGR